MLFNMVGRDISHGVFYRIRFYIPLHYIIRQYRVYIYSQCVEMEPWGLEPLGLFLEVIVMAAGSSDDAGPLHQKLLGDKTTIEAEGDTASAVNLAPPISSLIKCRPTSACWSMS